MDELVLNIVGGIFIFVIGACIGSFLNVVAYRVPLGLSIIKPPSSCPSCDTRIKSIYLVPIFGYFFSKRKCAFCREKISFRYPLVEICTAILSVLIFFKYSTPTDFIVQFGGNIYGVSPLLGKLRYGNTIELVRSFWFLYTGIALSLIDYDHRILPDVITLPGTVISLVLGWLSPEIGILGAVMGILVGAGGIFLVAKIYELIRNREGLGFGDVKYLAFIGAALGWQGVIWVIAIASILGSIIGITIAIATKKGMTYAVPFGPFLAIGALLIATWGSEIISILYQ